MISGAAQADVCLLMVPADGNFTTAIQKGDHKAGEIQGQTRQHARLINLLGVKQLLIGVNKMDTDTAGYKVGRPVIVLNWLASLATIPSVPGLANSCGYLLNHMEVVQSSTLSLA